MENELPVRSTRVLSGSSVIFFIPVTNELAFSTDDHHIQLSSGRIVRKDSIMALSIQSVDEFVKMMLLRAGGVATYLTVSDYAQTNDVDRGTVLKFCKSCLGAFYGAASVGISRKAWRLPDDIPPTFVILARIARVKAGVPARDLIVAALHTTRKHQGTTIRNLSKRLKINLGTVREAVRGLKHDGVVVPAGRGKIKLTGGQA